MRVSSAGFSALLLVQSVVVNGPLTSPAWVARPARPPVAELACTDYSSLFWATSVKDGVPHAAPLPLREHVDPLPFSIPAGRDRQGNRYVARVPDGWIVGFDDGEFGGGLWWFSPTGAERRRIRPSAPGAENVVGLPAIGGQRLVLMGLDHLTERSGRMFRLARDASGWRLEHVARLDAAPGVWLVAGKRLLFLTESGLWSAESTGSPNHLYEMDLGRSSASAMAGHADGSVYIGLRHYVLRLQPSNGRWRETWYTPASCLNVELRAGTCECVG